jgi:hypothetical protein
MNTNLLKIRIIQLLISNIGGIITPIASFLLSAALTGGTLWLGSRIPGLAAAITQINGSAVVASGATILTGICNCVLNSILKKEAYGIQKMLAAKGKDVVQDGWIGEETKQALHEVLGETPN